MSFDAQAVADRALQEMELKRALDQAKQMKDQLQPNDRFDEAVGNLSANTPQGHRRPVVLVGQLTLVINGQSTINRETNEVEIQTREFAFESAELRRLSAVAVELVEVRDGGRRLILRRIGKVWKLNGAPTGFTSSTGRRAGGRIYGHGPEKSG